MMKKRVLLPLLVAGMMVASVVSLDSCKKQDQTSKAVFTDTETPVIDNEISSERINYECPYCHEQLHHGDEHWHYFGTPMEGFDTDAMMESDRPGGVPHFWGVAECIDGLSSQACPYSGTSHNVPEDIQEMIDAYLAEFGITLTYDEANALLEPRFHAHRIYYRAIVSGAEANAWHVGGGVPGWPGPHPENPNIP